ncbi:MAG: peptide deformylase [Patescibacteria group bacterium]
MLTKIIQRGNKILRQIAQEVAREDIATRKIKNIIKNMTHLLAKEKNGVALAAPQIGEPLRIFIVNGRIRKKLPEDTKKNIPPMVFINPVIKKTSKKKLAMEEGCLSIPNLYGIVKRSEKITIEAYNEKGRKFILGASGILSQIIQHEMDHLNGVLFIDKATRLERVENLKRKE